MAVPDKLIVWSTPQDYRRRRDLFIITQGGDGREWLARRLEFVEVDPGLMWPDDSATVRDAVPLMQAMLDHAWEIGMRPTGHQEKDAVPEITAINRHLEDMRRIVFGPPPPVVVNNLDQEFERATR